MRRTHLRYALITVPFAAIGVAGSIGLLHTGDALAQPASTPTAATRPVVANTGAAPTLHVLATDCFGTELADNPLLSDNAPLVVDVDGFAPNAAVTVHIAGEPGAPVSQMADATGDLRTVFHTPAGLPAGQHVLTFTSASNGISTAYPFWTADLTGRSAATATTAAAPSCAVPQDLASAQ